MKICEYDTQLILFGSWNFRYSLLTNERAKITANISHWSHNNDNDSKCALDDVIQYSSTRWQNSNKKKNSN